MKAKKEVLLILAAVMLICTAMMSTVYGAAADASDPEITGIAFTPVEPYNLPELRGGYWTVDSNKVEYYRYWLPTTKSFNEGDKLTLTTSGGNVDYIFVKDKNAFINGDEQIKVNELSTEDKQGTEHWTLDKENSFGIKYKGFTAKVNVTLTPSKVTSISYTPVEPYKYYENDIGNGQWQDNGEWFYYLRPSAYTGDILTVKTADDPEGTDYVYDAPAGCYTSKGGEAIKGTDVYFKEDEKNTHWYPDTENDLFITLERATCTVNVVIEKSPLEAISFTPVEPYIITEGDTNCGYWVYDEDFNMEFVYNNPAFKDGDILTLKKKGEDPVDYVFNKKTYEFVSGDDAITHSSVGRKIKGEWKPGADNKLEISYLDQTYEVSVVILDNPVKAIAYQPADNIVLVVGDEEDGEWDGSDWEFYTPYFKDGDILSVTTADGVEDYLFKAESNSFICGDKTIPAMMVGSSETDHWEYGKTNEMIILYAGCTVKVPVTICEEHNHEDFMEPVAKVEPTCAAEGYEAHYDCSKCGKHFLKDSSGYYQTTLYKLSIDKLPHTIEEVPLKKATDKTAGHYRHWKCTECYAVFSDAEGKYEVDVADTIIRKNDFKVTVKKKLYTAKSKKKTVLKAKQLYNVKNKKGKVTYKKAGGNGKIKVAGNGNITVAKGLKKGKKYVVKVKVTSAGNAYYKASSKTVSVKIKIK